MSKSLFPVLSKKMKWLGTWALCEPHWGVQAEGVNAKRLPGRHQAPTWRRRWESIWEATSSLSMVRVGATCLPGCLVLLWALLHGLPASTGLVFIPVPPVLLGETPGLRASPSCDYWVTLLHLHHASASELKLLWFPLLLRDLPWMPTLWGASYHPPHPHPFTPALGTNLRTLWWQKWPKWSWVGRSTVGGRAPCLWSKNTQRTQCIWHWNFGKAGFRLNRDRGPSDSPHCCFLLLWIYFNPKDPGELSLRADDILSEVWDVTSFGVCNLPMKNRWILPVFCEQERSRLPGDPLLPDSDNRAGNASLLQCSDATVASWTWEWMVCIRLDCSSPLSAVWVFPPQHTGWACQWSTVTTTAI